MRIWETASPWKACLRHASHPPFERMALARCVMPFESAFEAYNPLVPALPVGRCGTHRARKPWLWLGLSYWLGFVLYLRSSTEGLPSLMCFVWALVTPGHATNPLGDSQAKNASLNPPAWQPGGSPF